MPQENPVKLQFAKRMREKPTKAEAALWEELRYFKYAKCRFQRQKVMCGFILDFYCEKRRLAIEVDGSIHRGKEREDAIRQMIVEKRKKISFLRFTNAQVLHRLHWTLEQIGKACKMRRNLPRIKPPRKPIPTIPQRSSSQQGLKPSSRKRLAENLNGIGKVDKSDKLNQIRFMDIRDCEKIVQKVVKDREPCQLQIFATEEVAANMVRRLKGLGIIAWVMESCTVCGLIHVIEQKKALTPRVQSIYSRSSP